MRNKWLVGFLLVVSLIVLCAAIGTIAFIALRPVAKFGPAILDINNANVSYQESLQKNFAVGDGAFLDLGNQVGDITITAADVSEIQINATKTTWGSNDEQAQVAMEKLVLTMTQDKDKVTVQVEESNNVTLNTQGRANTVDFEITVPAAVSMDVNTQSGDISLTGTHGKAVLESDFGNVDVDNVQGGLVVLSRSGTVIARQIDLLDSGFGDVSLQSDFGNVTLDQAVTEKVDAYSRSGDVKLVDVSADGEVKMNSDFGEITFETGRVGSLVVATRSGKVELMDVSVLGSLTAKSDFGNIELSQVFAQSYNLDTSSGSVTVDGAQGAVKVRSGFGSIAIEGGDQVTLNIETRNGEISYAGSLGEGPHHLLTDFGEIRLTLPADTALKVDLKTDFGSINTEFDVETSGEVDEQHWIGEIGSNGSALDASTRNGDIELIAEQ